MSTRHPFRWNPYADQPHNVAPKSERLGHHFRHLGSYLSLLGDNLYYAAPVLRRYRNYRKNLFGSALDIDDPFGLAFSPPSRATDDIIGSFEDLGIRKALIRVPSWERNRLPRYQEILKRCRDRGMEIVAALLQRREDILSPETWKIFLSDVFEKLGPLVSYFEIGHAWNRTKWGVWDHREYLSLAEAACSISREYSIKLVGPAVIDFEFHLYPPVLRRIPFDVFSSLLYVDRMGAPENHQAGWDLQKKAALLKAIVDTCGRGRKELWVTEMNWPLKGTGKFSPASGKPNVSESDQADYLVRYYVLCLASGFIRRIYWWQLAAPGYGLIDIRDGLWRKRPSYLAMKELTRHLQNSRFIRKLPHPGAHLFLFVKEGEPFLIAWTLRPPVHIRFFVKPASIKSLIGEPVPVQRKSIALDGSPKYITFEPAASPDDIGLVPEDSGSP